MMRLHTVFVAAAAISLGGCSSLQQTSDVWFGKGAAPASSSNDATKGQTYFAGIDELPVRSEASAASEIVGRLELHARVTRSKLENGYAYVRADKGGLAGWVDNAQLLRRIPQGATGSRPVKEPSPASAGAAAGASGTKDATEAPTAAPSAVAEEVPAAEPSPEVAPPEPTPTGPVPAEEAPTPRSVAPTPRAPASSVFDPF